MQFLLFTLPWWYTLRLNNNHAKETLFRNEHRWRDLFSASLVCWCEENNHVNFPRHLTLLSRCHLCLIRLIIPSAAASIISQTSSSAGILSLFRWTRKPWVLIRYRALPFRCLEVIWRWLWYGICDGDTRASERRCIPRFIIRAVFSIIGFITWKWGRLPAPVGPMFIISRNHHFIKVFDDLTLREFLGR